MKIFYRVYSDIIAANEMMFFKHIEPRLDQVKSVELMVAEDAVSVSKKQRKCNIM